MIQMSRDFDRKLDYKRHFCGELYEVNSRSATTNPINNI